MELKPKVSVVYISNRYGGLDILKSSLTRQTFQDFEIVFVDGLYDKRHNVVLDYFKDFNIKHIKDIDMKEHEGYKSKLARCHNQAYKACEGELIVLLQDYIYVPQSGLEKFWNIYNIHQNALITGISHQYLHPTKEEVVNQEGLITVYEKEYKYKPEVISWFDPRCDMSENYLGIRKAQPVEWEANWAAIPREVIYDLGGMDETYDLHGFGYDNTNIATRASYLGYPVYLDSSNEVFCISHDSYWKNEYKEKGIQPHEHHQITMQKMFQGEYPVKLNYLD